MKIVIIVIIMFMFIGAGGLFYYQFRDNSTNKLSVKITSFEWSKDVNWNEFCAFAPGKKEYITNSNKFTFKLNYPKNSEYYVCHANSAQSSYDWAGYTSKLNKSFFTSTNSYLVDTLGGNKVFGIIKVCCKVDDIETCDEINVSAICTPDKTITETKSENNMFKSISDMNLCLGYYKFNTSGKRDILGDLFCFNVTKQGINIIIQNNLNKDLRVDFTYTPAERLVFIKAKEQLEIHIDNTNPEIRVQVMNFNFSDLSSSELKEVLWKIT